MPLILAIDRDRRQAAQLATLVSARLRAELFQTASAAEALQRLNGRIPDLILTSPLLSPKDDDLLAEYLRDLGNAAAHVQTVRIPVLGGSKSRSSGSSVLGRLRRGPSTRSAPDGCDPGTFAADIAEYLARAAEERQAVDAQMTPPAAPRPTPVDAAPVSLTHVEAPAERASADVNHTLPVSWDELRIDAIGALPRSLTHSASARPDRFGTPAPDGSEALSSSSLAPADWDVPSIPFAPIASLSTDATTHTAAAGTEERGTDREPVARECDPADAPWPHSGHTSPDASSHRTTDDARGAGEDGYARIDAATEDAPVAGDDGYARFNTATEGGRGAGVDGYAPFDMNLEASFEDAPQRLAATPPEEDYAITVPLASLMVEDVAEFEPIADRAETYLDEDVAKELAALALESLVVEDAPGTSGSATLEQMSAALLAELAAVLDQEEPQADAFTGGVAGSMDEHSTMLPATWTDAAVLRSAVAAASCDELPPAPVAVSVRAADFVDVDLTASVNGSGDDVLEPDLNGVYELRTARGQLGAVMSRFNPTEVVPGQPTPAVSPAVSGFSRTETPATAPPVRDRGRRSPTVTKPARATGPKAVASPKKNPRRPKGGPAQDEWGLFDPEQCGFAALLDKLDEVTEEERAARRRDKSAVRVLPHRG